MTEECTTEFLLAILKHSNWEPNYDAVAKDWQLSNTNSMFVMSRAVSLSSDLEADNIQKVSPQDDC